MSLIPPRLCPLPPLAAPGGWSLVAWTDDAGEAALTSFLDEVDRSDPPLPVTLSHLRPRKSWQIPRPQPRKRSSAPQAGPTCSGSPDRRPGARPSCATWLPWIAPSP
jgi:hypothetical protein